MRVERHVQIEQSVKCCSGKLHKTAQYGQKRIRHMRKFEAQLLGQFAHKDTLHGRIRASLKSLRAYYTANYPNSI